jgi:hypothetical protein
MAMVEGSIVINALTGVVTTSTGAAGEVFDVLVEGNDLSSLDANPVAKAKALEQLAVMARAIAKIIPHIKDNATVSATVASGIAVSTIGSATAQTGTTTATGSASGTVS